MDKFWLRINQIYFKMSNVFTRNRKSPLWNVTARVQNFAFHIT